MAETDKKLGKMSLAILETIIEKKLGLKAIRRLHSRRKAVIAITGALQVTADRLSMEWANKDLWIATFNLLPKKKALLVNLKQAVKIFYDTPTDPGFAIAMTEILQEHEEFSPNDIDSAVSGYLTTLTEELALADESFRENSRGLSDLHLEEIVQRKDNGYEIIKLPMSSQTYESINPRQVKGKDLQEALACLRKLPEKTIPKPTSLPEGSRFPNIQPNPLFIGREAELRRLAVWLKGESTGTIGQVAAITGLGGVGKTLLASEFAQRYGQFFAGGVFWLSFAQPDLIPSEIAACAGPASDKPLDTRVKQVLSDWQSGLPRLLIFDNCEDPRLLVQWRPPAGGSRVLITSRQSSWNPGLGIEQLPLGLLERTESIALLQEFRNDLKGEDPNLDAITSELGDLPLALHIAGSFLRIYPDTSPADYLNALRRPDLLKQRSSKGIEFSPSGHDLDVGRTFALCVERLDQESETDRLALALLKRIACLVPGEFIPRKLLMKSVEEEKVEATVFEAGLNRLLGMGLVESNEAGEVRMHRLVAGFVRDTLPDRDALAQVELAVLSGAVDANQSGNMEKMLPLLAHLKKLTDQTLKRKDELAARLANELGFHLDEIADYAAARPYYEQALAIGQKVLGDDHPVTATSLNNLGGLLQATGDYAGARTYFEQALAVRRKTVGKEHPDTARSLNNLGSLLQATGDFAGAQPYFEEALAIRRKELGEEHHDTLRSLNNLASLLQAKGDYAGARTYFEQTLAIHKKLLGEEHPDTATSLDNLGGLLQAMGDYEGARPYYEQALAIRRKVLGDEHPATVSSLNHLGGLLQAVGDHAGARPFYEQTLSINRRLLGDDHPDTATSLDNLGGLLQAMGDYPSARPFFEQALAIRRKVLGKEHPDTARSLNNLGSLLQATGDYASARPYFEQALTINRRTLGEEHPDTATSLNNLGGLLQVMGDYASARLYFEQVLSINRKAPGDEYHEAASLNKRVRLPQLKVALEFIFILSLAFICWQVFSQGLVSSATEEQTVTPVGTGLTHFLTLTPRFTSTSSKTIAYQPTITSNSTFDFTPTVASTSTGFPTSTRTRVATYPFKTPTATYKPVEKTTPVPTSIPPTNIPPTNPPPTVAPVTPPPPDTPTAAPVYTP